LYSEREAREAGAGNYAVNKSVFLHVGINCRNPEKTKEFYVKYFNFRPARKIDVEGRQILFLSSGNISLELFKAEGELPGDSPQKDGVRYAGYRHIAFQVDDIVEKIAEIGDDAEITFGPVDLHDFIEGWRVVWIKDPDGRIIEISQGYK